MGFLRSRQGRRPEESVVTPRRLESAGAEIPALSLNRRPGETPPPGIRAKGRWPPLRAFVRSQQAIFPRGFPKALPFAIPRVVRRTRRLRWNTADTSGRRASGPPSAPLRSGPGPGHPGKGPSFRTPGRRKRSKPNEPEAIDEKPPGHRRSCDTGHDQTNFLEEYSKVVDKPPEPEPNLLSNSYHCTMYRPKTEQSEDSHCFSDRLPDISTTFSTGLSTGLWMIRPDPPPGSLPTAGKNPGSWRSSPPSSWITESRKPAGRNPPKDGGDRSKRRLRDFWGTGDDRHGSHAGRPWLFRPGWAPYATVLQDDAMEITP